MTSVFTNSQGGRAALDAGARFAKGGADGRDWRPMSSAPRDGTWVEIRCSYGVAPSYRVARWTDEDLALHVGGLFAGERRPYKMSAPGWVQRDGGGYVSEASLSWRPYAGEDPAAYVDPTGGAQDSGAYWRAASAVKQGLPPDAFEKIAERNFAKLEGRPEPDGEVAAVKTAFLIWLGRAGLAIACVALLFLAILISPRPAHGQVTVKEVWCGAGAAGPPRCRTKVCDQRAYARGAEIEQMAVAEALGLNAFGHELEAHALKQRARDAFTESKRVLLRGRALAIRAVVAGGCDPNAKAQPPK